MKSLSSIRNKEYLNPSSSKCVEGKVGANIYLDVSEDDRLDDPVWTFNGKHVDKECYSLNGLTLQNADFSQSGNYECIAKSGARYAFDVKIYEYLFGDQFLGIRTNFPGINIKEKTTGRLAKSLNSQPIRKIDEYSMSRSPRGIACIVVIDEFDFLPPLHGIKNDIDNCNKTFSHLQFDVRICNHKKAEDILQFIEKIANEDHSNYDCSVLYISSHGGDGFVCCEDFETKYLKEEKFDEDDRNSYKSYSTKSTKIFEEEAQSVDNIPKGYILFDTVIDVFVNSRTLLKKPKLFFLDTCRLPSQDIAAPTPEAPIRPFISQEQMQEQYSDILIGYASLLGKEAFLGKSGSAYTEILTYCLENLSPTESLADVMKEVDVRMKTRTTDIKQFSTHVSYLEKKLVMRKIHDTPDSEEEREQQKQREIDMVQQIEIGMLLLGQKQTVDELRQVEEELKRNDEMLRQLETERQKTMDEQNEMRLNETERQERGSKCVCL